MVSSQFLTTLFGEGGLVQQGLGNLWFMVAVFILVFFILLLAGYKITAENIVIFIMCFLLIVIDYGLFGIPVQFIVIPIVFIALYISRFAYNYFNN